MEIHCDVQIVKATSDNFFRRQDPLGHFPDRSIDFAFVDGLHLFEFALRDLMNIERYSRWTSVIVVDDVLPRSVAHASRSRKTDLWTGDVFKIAEVLGRYRPDLLVLQLDTRSSGTLLVLGADPHNRTLEHHYDEIVAEYVYPDPQRVPGAVLRRESAIDPASIVASGILADLFEARESGVTREAGWDRVRRAVEAAARPAERRRSAAATLQRKRPFARADPPRARLARAERAAKNKGKMRGKLPSILRRALGRLRRRL